jgi:hypothetical protein
MGFVYNVHCISCFLFRFLAMTSLLKKDLTLMPFEAPRFDIGDSEQAQQMLAHLEEHGFTVVAAVANADEIEAAKSRFWNYAEDVRPALRRDDVTTWEDPWIGGAQRYGVVGGGLVHSDFLWGSRLLPAVHRAFSLVWGTDDLIVSFDGGCAFRPLLADGSRRVASGWWHVDQNALLGPHRRGFAGVQGIVSYLDAGPASGGLCVVPGSHRAHDVVCATTGSLTAQGVPLDPADPVIRAGGLLVCARAGDLLLWDSRTVHCSAAPDATTAPGAGSAGPDPAEGPVAVNGPGGLLRLAAYVSMLPRARATPDTLAARKAVFESGAPAVGCHWADQAPLVARGRAAVAEPARPRDPRECSAAMRTLVGYEDGDRTAAERRGDEA